MDCLFCKIVKGEVPCKKIYEDELVMAFLDVDQRYIGHTLIIPKEHVTDMMEVTDDIILHMWQVAKNLINPLQKKLDREGITLQINYGFTQVIKHLHLHIIPKKKLQTKTLEEIYEITSKNQG